MNICLLVCVYQGGFKSFTDNLISILLEKGYDITIFNIGDSKIDFKKEKIINYDLNAIPKRKKRWFLGFLPLYRILKKKQFKKETKKSDMSKTLYYSELYTALSMLSYKDKLDLSNFDAVISTEEIACNYFLSKVVISKKKIAYIHPNYISAFFDPVIDYYFLKHVDYICTTSKANSESLKKALPKLSNKIRGIKNVINVNKILKKTEEPVEKFNDDVVNIITVCRLDNTSKALDRLLILAKQLKANNKRIIWRIIGDGWYIEKMQTFIKDNALADVLILMGYIENPIPYIKQSDLFVLQSYYEGYPMSVLEAMVVDVPVLITAYPSSSEQVENEKTGFIVENCYDSIYNKMLYLIDNPNKLKEIKNNLKHLNKYKFEDVSGLEELFS